MGKESAGKMRTQGKSGKRSIIRAAGTVLVGMGILLMLAGLCLFAWNRQEASEAAKRAQAALCEVKTAVEMGAPLTEDKEIEAVLKGEETGEGDVPTVTVDGYEYMGYLSIPELGLELPVMAQWSYPRLKIAPCRYYGSAQEENLVIAAHNYPQHFGGLSELEKGAEVICADMEGREWHYAVEAVEVLSPEAVEEMTGAGYALTLFTCTYGGANRVTVRCSAISEESESILNN